MAPTPDATATLESLPPEIYPTIGSHLTASELDGVTRASKCLRAMFLRSIFKTIGFSHQQRDVAGLLDLFVRGRPADEMADIWASVRCASFDFPALAQMHGDRLPPSQDALRRKIVESMALMTQLRHLSIDLERFNDMHLQTSNDASALMAQRWHQLSSLRLTGMDASPQLAAAIVRCCPRNVKAFDITGLAPFPLAEVALSHFGQLQRLRVYSPYSPRGRGTFPALNYISTAWKTFGGVEWLAVLEKPSQAAGSIQALYLLRECLERMATGLKKMRNLRRLAFTLSVRRFKPWEIRRSLGQAGNSNRELPCREALGWYAIQHRHIFLVLTPSMARDPTMEGP